ncbi:MAG: cryptochrome/photolyase family protein [Gammaproteobacteria bacterium]|nr:cryptochrome/photolyase family protein [Gammaproteobacteria bacterium]
MQPIQTIRLILGDQLNAKHSWFQTKDDSILYVIAELRQETNYVKHHVQKICAFFLGMQKFAEALKTAGHRVSYLTLDDTIEDQSLPELIERLCVQYAAGKFEYQSPDEYRLLNQLQEMEISNVQINGVDSEHFLLPFDEINKHFSANKATRMESFYRKMRKRFSILMEDDEPEGGRWNYDVENRKKMKLQDAKDVPEPLVFNNDVKSILDRLDRHKVKYFGNLTSDLVWPTTRRQALELLDDFCDRLLPKFGTFQDAMTEKTDHAWSLYHSRLSFAMNAKMISPKLVVDKAIAAYERNKVNIDLAQIEGFVRQIIGWREFIRGIYWINMPGYDELNSLNAERRLPSYFWTGDTKMNCLAKSIGQSLDYAYAHHIQRLMVTGNFCLLTGIDPDEVDEWYLGVYVDAIEWVEMPNTRGMSQFADGGIVASKPYSGGGAYINRMSDYCSSCHYNVKEKVGDKSCPMNSLYWHFMHRHRDRFGNNPRIGMVYRNLDKMDEEVRRSTLERAEDILNNLESL